MAPSVSSSFRMRFRVMRALPLTCSARARSRFVPCGFAASASSTASRVSAGAFPFLAIHPVYTRLGRLRHIRLLGLLRMGALGILFNEKYAKTLGVVGMDVVNAPTAVLFHKIEVSLARWTSMNPHIMEARRYNSRCAGGVAHGHRGLQIGEVLTLADGIEIQGRHLSPGQAHVLIHQRL